MSAFAEEVLPVWRDVSAYELIPFKAKKREMAQTIYDKYFKESGALALRSIGIDRETKLAVIKTLRVSNTDVVQQDDPRALEKVFHLVHAKIFNIIKFEHLPLLLVSKEFASLKNFTDFFEDGRDAALARRRSRVDVDARYTDYHTTARISCHSSMTTSFGAAKMSGQK